MKISLSAIKTYAGLPAELDNQEIIRLIGSRLVEVEEVVDLAPKYRNIYIVKVISAEPIPDTHLSLCQIDTGATEATPALQETPLTKFADPTTGLTQVVCGAPNVRAGMLAAWIAPGAVVPSTFGNEDFRLSVRKLRGYDSHGMLAALDELDLGTDHEGIIEIDPGTTWQPDLTAGSSLGARVVQPGDSFAEVFGLNDLILDVENKSLTHRPDCFGLIGFAREVAGILGRKFPAPEFLPTKVGKNLPKDAISANQSWQNPAETPIRVQISDPDLCPRYSAAVFDLPKNTPSKYLTPAAVFLAKAGMRSIDPMVDLTNILMLETGQPLHAFDYDKLIAVGGTTAPEIIVRAAEPGEKLQLLDGKTISCTPDDILITSNNVPVGLAGAMGGKNTEIDPSTTRIVLESATFSLYHLRKTQMAHGIFSEAITRFTKGQPAAQTLPVLATAVQRLGVQPLAVVDEYPAPVSAPVLKLTVDDINGLLGTAYPVDLIVQTLENVGFTITISNETLTVTAPVWRTDIHLKEDIIEEVGRLLGYDNIAQTLPVRPFLEAEIDPMLALKSELRTILSDTLSLNESLTYSFVSRALLEKVRQDPMDSYEIVNSISPELQCFRQHISPSLLDKVRENQKAGHRDFTLYEFGQVTTKSAGLASDQQNSAQQNLAQNSDLDGDVPRMSTHLGLVHLGGFYSLKALVLALWRELKLPLEYAALSPTTAQKHPYLEPARSAEITYQGTTLGAFGELRISVLRNFKLDPASTGSAQPAGSTPSAISALELNLDQLAKLPPNTQKSLKLSRFPFVERDLTLKVAQDLPFGQATNAIEQALSLTTLIYALTPVSIYQPAPDSPTKNLSFHLKFSDPAQTLSAAEISAIMEKIASSVSTLGAEIV